MIFPKGAIGEWILFTIFLLTPTAFQSVAATTAPTAKDA